MKVFIWERVEQCADNYHPEGGVVVIAETEERARELANMQHGCNIEKNEAVSYVVGTYSKKEKVFIFPDAGCC